jgi:hypothetical protein
MPMGVPRGTEQRAGLGGQGDVTVLGACAAVERDVQARARAVGDWQGQRFMEPKADTRDGGEGDVVMPQG